MDTKNRIPSTVEALQRLALSRDAEAWEVLLQLHGAAILRVCRRVLGDEALAEDACQESLLQLRNLAGQFIAQQDDAELAARAWIMRVACHTALNMMRKQRGNLHRENVQARDEERMTRVEAADGIERMMNQERMEAVRQTLAEMPDAEREPIVLHYYGNMNYEELSSALKCPVGTAKARVSRSVEKLRRRLALLGLLFTAAELTGLLQGSSASASEQTEPDAKQVMQWKSLLASSQKAIFVLPPLEKKKGFSTMAKTSMGIAALLVMGGIGFFATGSNGADSATEGLNARPQSTPSTDAEKRSVVDGCNTFAFDLYTKLVEKEKGNLFFSPYSISTALAMTYAGAKGETAAQMAKALHFALGQERLHPSFEALIREQNEEAQGGKKRGYQLSVANRLWGQKGFHFLSDFITLTQKHYSAGLQDVDFRNATEVARLTINTWVEQKTMEKIKNLIQPGALTPDVRLVLTNAIYFKGDWAVQFKKESTQNSSFHLATSQSADVPMMNQTGNYKYLDGIGNFQALELPYVNNELAMVIFLPAKIEEFAEFEKTFNMENAKNWISQMKEKEVLVSIPKFKLEWGTFDLKDNLIALGIRDAFSAQKADFSGMTLQDRLYISLVLHKAFVEVNEEGTTAAAATAVIMRDGARPAPSPIFQADHPFLFLIRDTRNGSVLFMGRVMDPR